ncbi:MAG: hypothetical protein ERJ67_01715, partial [Aphanocapsa feldmannii 277cV]
MDPDLQHHDGHDDVVAAYQDRVAAEQQLTRALAAFQARVAAISRPDLAAVSEAARPLFRQGVGWSAQLLSEQGRRRLRITVMHTAGAELSSEEWADEVDDLLQAAGWMLAMLLGIPVASSSSSMDRTAEPGQVAVLEHTVKPSAASADPALSDRSHPEPPQGDGSSHERLQGNGSSHEQLQGDGSSHERLQGNGSDHESLQGDGADPALTPLTKAEIAAYHQRILALPVEVRRELTSAFRLHFQVPRSARSIGDRISQHQH